MRIKIHLRPRCKVNYFKLFCTAFLTPYFHPQNHVNVDISSNIVDLLFILGSCFVHTNNQIFVLTCDDRAPTLPSKSTDFVRNNVILD